MNIDLVSIAELKGMKFKQHIIKVVFLGQTLK